MVSDGKVGSKSKFASHLKIARVPDKSTRGLLGNFKMAAKFTFQTYFSNLLFQNTPMVCLERVTKSKFDDLIHFLLSNEKLGYCLII